MGREPKDTTARKDRPTKRTLVRWTEDMDVQLLLNLQKVCNSKGIKLPWDEAAALVGPTITGNAATQHLAKLCKKRVLKNLPVPDPLTRGGGGIGVDPRGAAGTARETQNSLTSNDDDDEEDFDVDKASDSGASFGEERKKRKKRGAMSTTNKLNTDVSDNEKPVKGGVFSIGKLNKTNKAKDKKRVSIDTTREGIKMENLPSPNLAAVERAAERNTPSKARNDGHDPDETVTESEVEDPGLAIGSSILKLVNVENDAKEETKGDHAGIQGKGATKDGNHKVTVLKIGKNRSISGPISASSLASTNQDASMGLGFDMDMAENPSYPQYYGQHTTLCNFGAGANRPFQGGGSAGNFSSFPAFPYSTAMNTLMPPTPMSGYSFVGFPSDSYGTNIGLGDRVAYSAAYSSGVNMPAFLAPYTPGSSHESTEFLEGTFGGYGNSGQTSYHSSSGNMDNMGNIDFGDVDFDSIDTSGVGEFDHTSRAFVDTSTGFAQDPATSGTAYDWTNQPGSALSMPDDEEMLQILNSGSNNNVGEPKDSNSIFGEFETHSGGSVGSHRVVQEERIDL